MIKIIKCLVAIDVESGKFFNLIEDVRTTTPEVVDHPYDAKKIFPHNEEDFENPKPAPYYFESSDRMREWLKGFRMVCVELIIDYMVCLDKESIEDMWRDVKQNPHGNDMFIIQDK